MRYVMFLALIACSGSEKPGEDAADADAADDADGDADGDSDADTDSDADVDSSTTDTSVTVPGSFFEPVAVGFEYFGGILADGTLAGYRFPNDPPDATQVYAPAFLLTFASLAYFDATDAAGQEAESCTVAVILDQGLTPTVPPIPVAAVDGGPNPIFSYELALPVDPANSTCLDGSSGGQLDPAIWGPGGSNIDILDAFNGAHYGFAFGPLTPYAQDGFAQADQDDPEVMGAALAEYIAINDKYGNWVGIDWSHAVMFEWDEATQEVLIDGAGAGTFADVTTGIPSGYLSSGAHWLQDFPLMDLSNLKDGAR